MVTIYFFVNREGLKETRWPCVPGIGDTIVMGDPIRNFEVTEIVWDDKGENTVARVHLKEKKSRGPMVA